MALSRFDLYGSECDWFAVDDADHVALCCTAGYGEIPASVLDCGAEGELPDRLIGDLIDNLTEVPGNPLRKGEGALFSSRNQSRSAERRQSGGVVVSWISARSAYQLHAGGASIKPPIRRRLTQWSDWKSEAIGGRP